MYTLSHIIALPSLWECGPLTVLEAMQLEKPVIGTKVGLMPDAISDNETGFLIEPGDSHALAEKLRLMLRDPQLASAMEKRGRIRCESYDVSHSIERLERIYYQLLAE